MKRGFISHITGALLLAGAMAVANGAVAATTTPVAPAAAPAASKPAAAPTVHDAKAACEAQAKSKQLQGAARESFEKKCAADMAKAAK